MKIVSYGMAAWLILAGVCWSAENPSTVPSQNKTIAFITGDDEYRSEITLPMIAEILAKRHGFTCSVAYAVKPETGERDPKYQKNIAGLEALMMADLVVMFTRFRALPDEQLNMILDYVHSGRPIVGLRTSTHAFLYPDGPNVKWNNGFGEQVFGQRWITHHGHESTTDVEGIPAMASHPILRGVSLPFHAASWLYHVTPLIGDCTPLLQGHSLHSDKINDQERYPLVQPVAWTKTFTGAGGKAARVFFTTLGHPSDFSQESMRKLLLNGIYWALGMEDRILSEGVDARPVEAYIAPPTH